jgi:DNA-directed RNA polymerase subunit RPC12/RpoP
MNMKKIKSIRMRVLNKMSEEKCACGNDIDFSSEYETYGVIEDGYICEACLEEIRSEAEYEYPTEEIEEQEEKTYECPRCSYKQNFDTAYMDSGKFCPNCDYQTNIPLSYWK